MTDYISTHSYGKRKKPISKITIHHMAVVNPSMKAIGDGFRKPSRSASANYGISTSGEVWRYLPEDEGAMTSSNKSNDMIAVTIEVANSKGAPNWEISKESYDALIDLCVDICKRNNIEKVFYTGDKNGNLTEHRMFSATACPGNYIHGLLANHTIENDINKRLSGNVTPKTNKAIVNTKSDNLYIRRNPNGEILSSFRKGTEVTILSKENNWWKVSGIDYKGYYREGYCHSSYLKEV